MEETRERMQNVLESLFALTSQKIPRLPEREQKLLLKKKETLARDCLTSTLPFRPCSVKATAAPLLLYSDILASNNAEEDFGIPGLRAMLLSLFPGLHSAPLSQGAEKAAEFPDSRIFLAASGLPGDFPESPLCRFLKKKGRKVDMAFCVKNASDRRMVRPLSRNIVSTCGLQRENIEALRRFLISKKREIGYTSLPEHR